MTPSVTRAAFVAGSLLAAALAGSAAPTTAATDGSTGAAGSERRQRGRRPRTGGGSGAAGSSPLPFMAVDPCTDRRATTPTRTTTIDFPMTSTAFTYSPKCLKVPAGTTVTFAGDFAVAPARAVDACAGTLTGNPITSTSGGAPTKITVSLPDARASTPTICTFHGPSDGARRHGRRRLGRVTHVSNLGVELR